ncbi:MAG: lipid A deacylase LpxR family protein [Zavarzinia sp.]|nr:lipid A deacylase LpxR family protein [Zavarzinia sp.]
MIAYPAVLNGTILSATLLAATLGGAAGAALHATAAMPSLDLGPVSIHGSAFDMPALLASLTVKFDGVGGKALPGAGAGDTGNAPAPTATAGEDPRDDKGTLSLQVENDKFGGGTDQHYTNGMRASYLLSSDATPFTAGRIARDLPLMADEGVVRLGFSVGQSIFTPGRSDVTAAGNQGRPFAGWLYGGVQLTNDRGDRLDSYELQVGVVGPSAGAGEMQNWFHDAIGVKPFDGWDSQLSDELGVVLSYERKWRLISEFHPGGLGVALEPSVGATIGNVHTYASASATLKIGSDVSSDWGAPRIRTALSGTGYFRPVNDFEWYVFAGVEGRAVARNIFLDGNSFANSHSVDKEPLVADLQVGAAVTMGDMRLTFTQVFRTREYAGQREGDVFGALSLSWRI